MYAVVVTSADGIGDIGGNKRGDHGTSKTMVQCKLTVRSSRSTDKDSRTRSRGMDTRLETQTRFQLRRPR